MSWNKSYWILYTEEDFIIVWKNLEDEVDLFVLGFKINELIKRRLSSRKIWEHWFGLG